ncbi:MAG: hypothetical protein QM733_03815 [Ilumatobacteraceae bacterium]
MTSPVDELGVRLRGALERRDGRLAPPTLTPARVWAGVRRRRQRRRAVAVLACVVLLALVVPVLRRSHGEPAPAEPMPMPLPSSLPVMAILDGGSTPTSMSGDAGGAAIGQAVPAIDVWVAGTETVVVRTQHHALDVAPPPTTAAPTTTAPGVATTVAPDQAPPWSGQPARELPVRGVTGAVERLADAQFALWIPGVDPDSYTLMIGRGMSQERLVAIADAAVEVDGALRPDEGFSRTEHHDALASTAPASAYADVTYAGGDDTIHVVTQPGSVAGRTLESVSWYGFGPITDVDGRQVLTVTSSGVPTTMWVDPAGVIVGVWSNGSSAAELVDRVRLVDRSAWLALGRTVMDGLRDGTRQVASATVGGHAVSIRRGGTQTAMCVDGQCALVSSAGEEPASYMFSGVAGGRWVVAGYRQITDDEASHPQLVDLDDVHVTMPDGTVLPLDRFVDGRTYWYTVDVPDGAQVVHTDVGMTLGGIIGDLARPLLPIA